MEINNDLYQTLLMLYLYFEEYWMEGTPPWDKKQIKDTLKEFIELNNLKTKEIYSTLRYALTGYFIGIDVIDILLVLDKKESFERIISCIYSPLHLKAFVYNKNL